MVSDLLYFSDQPDSDVPSFNHSQRAFLQIATPVTMVNGYVLISVPHEAAKSTIENDLGTYIVRILNHYMGKSCSLAVSISAPQDDDWDSSHSPAQASGDPRYTSRFDPRDVRSPRDTRDSQSSQRDLASTSRDDERRGTGSSAPSGTGRSARGGRAARQSDDPQLEFPPHNDRSD